MSKWQPIETAPKDGTRLLLSLYHEDINPKYLVKVAYWDTFDKCFYTEGRGHAFRRATHWLPLPPTPIPEDEEHEWEAGDD